MSKIQFDIKYRPQIESGEYKVETRDGKPVRIICWDRKYGYPIVGLAYEKAAGRESYVNACLDGTAPTNEDDLFIITPDEELTEFEKVVKDRFLRAFEYSETFRNDENKWIRELSAELLAIAKKEILKDLPRWKKWEYGTCGDGRGIPIALVKRGLDSYKLVNALVIKGEKYIMLSDLEELPGFKED